jgi:hypothetical protein
MPQAEPRLTKPMDNVAWLSAQFDLHAKRMHPREDVKKNAIKIVKEA